MDKEKQTTIITYSIIISISLFLAYAMIMSKTVNFTEREFCIQKGKLDQNLTPDQVVGWDSSCFHPFDNELPMFKCRIKCEFG
jgi:hypothetical protein